MDTHTTKWGELADVLMSHKRQCGRCVKGQGSRQNLFHFTVCKGLQLYKHVYTCACIIHVHVHVCTCIVEAAHMYKFCSTLNTERILFVDSVVGDVSETLLHAALLFVQLSLPLREVFSAISQLLQSLHCIHHIHHLTGSTERKREQYVSVCV